MSEWKPAHRLQIILLCVVTVYVRSLPHVPPCTVTACVRSLPHVWGLLPPFTNTGMHALDEPHPVRWPQAHCFLNWFFIQTLAQRAAAERRCIPHGAATPTVSERGIPSVRTEAWGLARAFPVKSRVPGPCQWLPLLTCVEPCVRVLPQPQPCPWAEAENQSSLEVSSKALLFLFSRSPCLSGH